MKIKDILSGIAAKGVIGTALKSGAPLADAATGKRGKLAIIIGAIAAALGYAANYL